MHECFANHYYIFGSIPTTDESQPQVLGKQNKHKTLKLGLVEVSKKLWFFVVLFFLEKIQKSKKILCSSVSDKKYLEPCLYIVKKKYFQDLLPQHFFLLSNQHNLFSSDNLF